MAFYSMLKETYRGWNRHHAMRLGAAMAFYTVFAIAPLVLIVLAIAGFWFGEEAARRELYAQLNGLVGERGGEAIQAIVASADKPAAGTWATVVALITLLVGASGVFVQLRDALNIIWELPWKPGRGIWFFLRTRLLSFAMILAIGFLLLVSLVISACLAALGKHLSGLLPAHAIIWQVVNFSISLGLITLLFAMIFKLLPDVHLDWRDVWAGALFSAILFNAGKFALGYYLGRSSVASAYGAASSVVIILLWVYYSSQTLFLGAEFSRVCAARFGRRYRHGFGTEITSRKTDPLEPDRAQSFKA